MKAALASIIQYKFRAEKMTTRDKISAKNHGPVVHKNFVICIRDQFEECSQETEKTNLPLVFFL
jgi:hypothetical protein